MVYSEETQVNSVKSTQSKVKEKEKLIKEIRSKREANIAELNERLTEAKSILDVISNDDNRQSTTERVIVRKEIDKLESMIKEEEREMIYPDDSEDAKEIVKGYIGRDIKRVGEPSICK